MSKYPYIFPGDTNISPQSPIIKKTEHRFFRHSVIMKLYFALAAIILTISPTFFIEEISPIVNLTLNAF